MENSVPLLAKNSKPEASIVKTNGNNSNNTNNSNNKVVKKETCPSEVVYHLEERKNVDDAIK